MEAPGRTTPAPAEIVAHFRLPLRAHRSGDAYLRLIPRTEMDIAIDGAAVRVTVADDSLSHPLVVPGAVPPPAVPLPHAAAPLTAPPANPAALPAAAALDEAGRAAGGAPLPPG